MTQYKDGDKYLIDIDKLNVKGNIRKDYAHVAQLAENIKKKGQLDPILVQLKGLNVVDGFSRIGSFEILKIKKIKAEFRDMTDQEVREYRFVKFANRKGLNVVEEGEGFIKYMHDYKVDDTYISRMITKPIDYVHRRVILAGLRDEIKKAVIDRKITAGHALALARMTDQKLQLKLLKITIKDKDSVETLTCSISNEARELNQAFFDITACSKCPHNGGEQQTLYFGDEKETASNLSGDCLDKRCFDEKTKDAIKAKTEELKKKGLNVMSLAKFEKLDHHQYMELGDWEKKDKLKKKYKSQCKKCEDHVYAFTDRWSQGIKVIELCLKLNCYGAQKSSSTKSKSQKTKENSEKFEGKINIYRREEQLKIMPQLFESNSLISCGVVALTLVNSTMDYQEREKFMDSIGIKEDFLTLAKVRSMDETKLRDLIGLAAKSMLNSVMGRDELSNLGVWCGMDWSKHWCISEDFLQLHTKENLANLAKELDIDIKKAGSKPAMIAKIMESDIEGKVPQIILDKRRRKK